MRPPSYYTSLANSNPSTSTSYRSSNSTSSQFRSTFGSSPASSSYVNRTHLPYVSQSMLVAHCITGVGSSTRPYSSNHSSSISISSNSTSSSPSSSSSSLLSSNYRPLSTKNRHSTNPYLNNSNSSTTYSSTPSSYSSTGSYSTRSPSSKSTIYLSPLYSSSASPYRTSYQRTTSNSRPALSSYYQPIRLRERPLLTQISRQLNNNNNNNKKEDDEKKVENFDTTKPIDDKRNHSADNNNNNKSIGVQRKEDDETWSSDVARNISRNKYLIKFREFDKRASISPIPAPSSILDDESSHQTSNIELKPLKLIDSFDTNSDKVASSKEPNLKKISSSTTSELSKPIRKVKNKKLLETTENKEETTTIKMRIPIANKLSESSRPAIATEPSKTTDLKPKKNIKLDKTIQSGVVDKKPVDVETNKNSNKLDCDKTIKQQTEILVKEKENDNGEKSKVNKNIKLKIKNVNNDDKKLIETTTSDKKVVDETKGEALNLNLKQPILIENKSQQAENKILINDKTSPKDADQSLPKVSEQATKEAKINSNTMSKPKVKKLVKSGSKTKLTTSDNNNTTEQKPKRKVLVRKLTGELKNEKIKSSKPEKTKSTQTKEDGNSSSKENCESSISLPIVAQNITTPPIKENKRIRFRNYNLEDFNFLSVLGHGGWGFVILAELKEYDACFAVKCIKKITIVEDDDFDSIMIERKVLTLGNVHPFICKLFCTFETDGYLFFVMEYCAGGDLMFHVQREGKFTESRCRFYAAEIICAIRFLHNRHIIYR